MKDRVIIEDYKPEKDRARKDAEYETKLKEMEEEENAKREAGLSD